MVPMPKSAAIAATILVGGLIGTVGTSRTAHATDGCLPVFGHLQATFTTTNCTSPVGLCMTGTITNGGILDSSTVLLVLDAAPSAGLPTVEPSANVSYSGSLSIDAAGGMLMLHDLGVVDGVHMNFTELERPQTGSTGIFTNATNDFFISGSVTNSGNSFNGYVYGELCGLGF
jgi:hypothetical protein